MASVISKRSRARNERALQELLHVPGNDQCADCQARNPGWASWNLGVFLCMRCGSIHRKLGTHISKVKSLSMDTWSTDQVESMRRNGNISANKVYNPKNVRPDMPLDADEVDGAMERFIRKKYQERSLTSGKPRIPSRSDTGPTLEASMGASAGASFEESPPPPLPPKKGKLFGFKLRASSSAYPQSANDKKKLPKSPRQPDFESAFGVASTDYEEAEAEDRSPVESRQRDHFPRQRPRGAPHIHKIVTEDEVRERLKVLKEMGFPDERRNETVLRGRNGNLEKTIEDLARIGSLDKASDTPAPPPVSDNPFERLDQQPQPQATGLSFDNPPPSQQISATNTGRASTNPFDAVPVQSQPSWEQAFHGMQISQPLFPNTTGGYPAQQQPMFDQRQQYSMTPPVPSMPQQYSYVASPPAMNNNANPFFQTQQPQFSNPYANTTQNPPMQSPSANPFFNQSTVPQSNQLSQTQQQYQQPQTSANPFGIPPDAQSQQQRSMTDPQAAFGQLNQPVFNMNAMSQQPFQQQPSQQAYQQSQQPQSTNSNTNPFLSMHIPPTQNQPAPPPLQTFQPQQPQQQLMPQQTGRYDKSSILALYNYPHLAPQREPLASVPENQDPPSSNGNPGPKRSATMPVGMSTSRNPFMNMNNGTSSNTSRHGSQESMAVNGLSSGRHSPDAFANLSSQYR